MARNTKERKHLELSYPGMRKIVSYQVSAKLRISFYVKTMIIGHWEQLKFFFIFEMHTDPFLLQSSSISLSPFLKQTTAIESL